MNLNKKEVLQTLEKIAVYLEIQGANAFRVSAYRKAAQTLEKDERSLEELGDPAQLNGIGKGTAAIILDLHNTGTTELFDELKEEVPSGLIPLLKLQGLGGKKIGRLYQELGITSADELKKACEDKRVQAMSGFGKKTEEKILQALEEMGQRPERLTLAQVQPAVEMIGAFLNTAPGVLRWETAGSYRRGRETVKDLDFIVAASDAAAVAEAVLQAPFTDQVQGSGETKISLDAAVEDLLVPVDFRIVEDRSFAAALHHFTGSKDHNVLMRQRAKAAGQKISEYGVEDADDGSMVYFQTEEAFFRHFDLPWIPPEVREGGNELEQDWRSLVKLDDIQGDMHMHTTWSDGAQSIEEMADQCLRKGYSFMAITDHSQYLKVANGLTPERLQRQHEEVRRVREEKDIHLFTGVEMDILPDGTMDYDKGLLAEVDYVIASIHSAFQQEEEQIMHRLVSACRHPYVRMIAHPTGRLIGRREGYAVDEEQLIRTAAETGTVLELNANPNRLDLAVPILIKAEKEGVLLSVNTDAHHYDMLEDMAVGIKAARRAGISKDTIINTWDADRIKAWLEQPKSPLVKGD
ncbi:DNA polymerase/3'-5' exonuclease PolX [Alkalicoccus chagannorensis]|uniref:DNA polymerase/3'-5' exonuclease PolX n=1 Tax=Alkalicoccus chagannorensis TaxID=427072 RepID=UPI00047BC3A9|nr:DNA polymerase/3'-5' exonuclease PolX [Alkalicoccus chagannorensis]